MRHVTLALIIALLSAAPAQAQAQSCTLIADKDSMETLVEYGDCQTRRGAQSTFKIPLALMGFDSGILIDAHNPTWNYKAGYTLNRPEDKHPTDPTYWEKESVVWYSQKLTRELGADAFTQYVEQFDYGNKDISGNPGKNDGLTKAWLSSSLQISPDEQISFLQKLLNNDLGVSAQAHALTRDILPTASIDGWVLHGKTGTGFHRHEDGTKDYNLQEGWYVGWAEKSGKTLIFAKFIKDKTKQDMFAGPRARDQFMEEFSSYIAKKDSP